MKSTQYIDNAVTQIDNNLFIYSFYFCFSTSLYFYLMAKSVLRTQHNIHVHCVRRYTYCINFVNVNN